MSEDTKTSVPATPSSEGELVPSSLPPAFGRSLVPLPPSVTVPTESPPGVSRKSTWKIAAMALVVVIGAAGGGAYWWVRQQGRLPVGIVSGNGRIEAEEIDIDTKFAGRLVQRLADEGDMVKAGQVVARMDTRDLQATLEKSEAGVQEARRTLDEAHANVEQQKTQGKLARQQLDRTNALVARGYATQELLDQRQQTLNASDAALSAAGARVGETERALDAATHDVQLYKVNIADNTLVSPTIGRIQYRIADVGEVLPAGGKVFTILDVSDVYMDVYLPTIAAGRIANGSEARIVLDSYPNMTIPARVTFVATQAQFTPKAVETEDERDKLMFRVKVRVDPELLLAHAAQVRAGLPGRAYLRTDSKATWPAELAKPLSP